MDVVSEPVTVRLELESHPQNVALVRSALTGISEALSLGPEMTADIKTALSEACNNVALHAYERDTSGPMTVELGGSSSGIRVTVIDRGRGITRISGGEERMGLGLAVISALADSSEFRHPSGGGTEVRMWFRGPAGADFDDVASSGAPSLPGPPHDQARADDEILAYFAPVGIMRYVLGRMVQSLAASSHFSVTKISDLRAANEAIAGYIEVVANGGVSISISSSARRLRMKTGRLPEHDPESARAALGAVVDTVGSEPESLHVELLDRSRDSA